MIRRNFLRQTAAGLSLASLRPLLAQQKRKPNILFLWTDQQRADTLAAYGNHLVDAPHLNRLASQSVVFERPYVTQPVCTPSRGSILTGLYPHQHGAAANNVALPPAVKTLPEHIGDSSYATAYYGKWHLGDEVLPRHGFSERISTEDDYDEFVTDPGAKGQRSDYFQYLVSKGYRPSKKGLFTRNEVAGLPVDDCKPAFLARAATAFLSRHAKSPFVLSVNFIQPHSPYDGPFNGLHDPARIPLPSSFAHRPGEDMPLRYRLFAADNRKRGEADFRRIAANYYGMVHQVDLAVGQILAELEKQGLDGNTIVAFTSDHGEMLGAHGMLAKSVMYEESIKVPFFIRVPGVAPKRVPGATTNLHLTPTLLDLLDRHPAAPLAGRSLAPNLRSGKSTGEDVFIEWNPNRLAPLKQSAPDTIPGVPLEERHRAAAETQRAIVTQGGQKLVLSSNGHSHFFDLRRDPAELQNAFTDPARQQDIGRLRARLAAWRKTTQDTVKL